MAALPRGLVLRNCARLIPLASRSSAITARTISTVTAGKSTLPRERPAVARFGQANKLPAIHKRWLSDDSEEITVDYLKEETQNVLRLFDKVNPEKVTLDAHFMKDLGLDSLDAMEIVMAFEDEFGVEITDEEAEKIFTCNDAVELLKVKLNIES